MYHLKARCGSSSCPVCHNSDHELKLQMYCWKTLLKYRKTLTGLSFDVGAHVGSWHVFLQNSYHATYIDDPVVVSVEPNPRNVAALQTNIKDRGKSIVVEVAAWSGNEVLTMLEKGPGSRIDKKGSLQVQGKALDDLFHISYSDPDLVKIDVEGAELHVIRGMKRILKQCAVGGGILVVEVSAEHLKRYEHTPQQLLQEVEDLGFRLLKPTKWNVRTQMVNAVFAGDSCTS